MGTVIRRTSAILAVVVASMVSTVAEAKPRLTFEDEVIEGEVQKPEIAVIISRENLTKSYNLELKRSFLPKILESVEEKPF